MLGLGLGAIQQPMAAKVLVDAMQRRSIRPHDRETIRGRGSDWAVTVGGQ
jgi:hypothetical protein